MEIVLLLTWLPVASLMTMPELQHVEDFIRQRRYYVKNKYRPNYHITAPEGWLSNPAGFTYYKRQYHIFYQYYPNKGSWARMHLGHAVSENLVDWSHYPAAVVPKDYYDRHGCYSGSTQVLDDHLYLFYTGKVFYNNQTFETQSISLSNDGVFFQKYLYNPVIRGSPNGVVEFRNPKVWKFRYTWYMMLGTSSRERNGELLLYTSHDMYDWQLNNTLVESYGDMGDLWESPEIFEIEDQYVLIISAHGVQSDDGRFKNLYQSGYVLGNFNYLRAQFDELEISTATFNELDYGHDFYAPKAMVAPDGRVLLVAWLGMWESNFKEKSGGWAGMLTVVREVTLNKQGRLLMTPVREISQLRAEVLEEAWYRPGEGFLAGAKFFEMLVNSTSIYSDVDIRFEWTGGRYTIGFSAEYGQISVDRGGEDGVRRADWYPGRHIYLHILVDSSSIEVFCGEGEVVFSSRIYPKSIRIRIGGNSHLHITQFSLRRSIGFDRKLMKFLKNRVVNDDTRSLQNSTR